MQAVHQALSTQERKYKSGQKLYSQIPSLVSSQQFSTPPQMFCQCRFILMVGNDFGNRTDALLPGLIDEGKGLFIYYVITVGQIRQGARIRWWGVWGVNPILAMPLFWMHMVDYAFCCELCIIL